MSTARLIGDKDGGNARGNGSDPSALMLQRMLDQRRRMLASSKRPVVFAFVPGGQLVELIRSFGAVPLLPEMKGFVDERGTGPDAPSVRNTACHLLSCALALERSPRLRAARPALVITPYGACPELPSAFERLRPLYDAPVISLHLAYDGNGCLALEGAAVAAQLRRELLPALQEATGRPYDEKDLRRRLRLSRQATAEFSATLKLARLTPSPVDAYFGMAGAMDPVFSLFRGTDDGLLYYRQLRREAEARAEAGQGPVTPSGPLDRQQFRLVFDGYPRWAQRRDLWRLFAARGAVFVGATHGMSRDLEAVDGGDPLQWVLARGDGCTLVPDLLSRVERLVDIVRDLGADGFVVQADARCEALADLEQTVLAEVQRRTGRPGLAIFNREIANRAGEGSTVARRIDEFLRCVEARVGECG